MGLASDHQFSVGVTVQAPTEFSLIPLIVLIRNSPGLSATSWLIGPVFLWLTPVTPPPGASRVVEPGAGAETGNPVKWSRHGLESFARPPCDRLVAASTSRITRSKFKPAIFFKSSRL